MIDAVKEKKTVKPGKQVELEKGDFQALISAAAQVFGPVLIGALLFFAIIIFIITKIWS
mgnify:CR=1